MAQVFFDASQDDPSIYLETQRAVKKFKKFSPESLTILTEALNHSSIAVAYHSVLLLGELGISRSEELGQEGRNQVANAIVRVLQGTEAGRQVYDFKESVDGKKIDPLYDALLRVVTGQTRIYRFETCCSEIEKANRLGKFNQCQI